MTRFFLFKKIITVVDFVFPAPKDCCEERRSYNKRHGKEKQKKKKSILHALISVLSQYAPVSDKVAYRGLWPIRPSQRSLFPRNRIKAFVVSSRKFNSSLLVPLQLRYNFLISSLLHSSRGCQEGNLGYVGYEGNFIIPFIRWSGNYSFIITFWIFSSLLFL